MPYATLKSFYFILGGRTLKELSSEMMIPYNALSKIEEDAKGI